MLLETAIQKIKSEFSSLHFVVNKDKRTIIIPPICKGFGDLEIQEDDNELIVVVGNFTHWHAGCYEKDLSDEEKAEIIAEDVAVFLHDVFDDKIVMWGSHREGGGFIYINEQQTQECNLNQYQKWLWSRPIFE